MLGIPLSLALLASPSASLRAPQQESPPGLVRVAGERVKVGTPAKVIEQMIAANEEFASVLASETPQHTVAVEDFFLMVTEVTNEQYQAYVRATDSKPPQSWGGTAIDAGRATYLEEQHKANQEALARGERPQRALFDETAWWEKNWRESEWQVPQDQLDRPVTYVTYADALGYCRWAGLRLMNEVEYQCAARGESERSYPWGDEWEDRRYAASLHFGQDRPQAVGRFPEGAVNGVFDLAGNVWEWTSSPYVAYPGYAALEVKLGKGAQARTISALAQFDPNRRVTVGGSYKNPRNALRVATRFGADRIQSTDALGFRCAGSPQPGFDVARATIDGVLDFRVLPADLQFFPEFSVVAHRWTSEPGTVKVEGYAVITGYEHMMFVPVQQAPGLSVKELQKLTAEQGPAYLGFLVLSKPTLEPALAPGVYTVAWRGQGKLAVQETPAEEGAQNLLAHRQDAQVDFTQTPGFDPEKDLFLVFDLSGTPVASVPSTKMDYGRFKSERGSVKVLPFVPPPPPKKGEEPAEPVVPMDTLAFQLQVAGRQATRGYLFELPLKIEPGSIDSASWGFPGEH